MDDCKHTRLKCRDCMREVDYMHPGLTEVLVTPDNPELTPALDRIKALEAEVRAKNNQITVCTSIIDGLHARIAEMKSSA